MQERSLFQFACVAFTIVALFSQRVFCVLIDVTVGNPPHQFGPSTINAANGDVSTVVSSTSVQRAPTCIDRPLYFRQLRPLRDTVRLPSAMYSIRINLERLEARLLLWHDIGGSARASVLSSRKPTPRFLANEHLASNMGSHHQRHGAHLLLLRSERFMRQVTDGRCHQSSMRTISLYRHLR
jgi:hypothetical protein